jgi:PAS domain S-box-containing protein
MSQRRKIAIAYAFAVPVVLLIVLFLHASLLGVSGSAGEMVQAAQVMQEVDSANLLLKEAGANAQKYVNSGGDQSYNVAYQKSVAALRDTLQKIGERTKAEQSVQAKLRTLWPLVSKQLGLFDQAMATVRKNSADRGKPALGSETPNLLGDIDKIMGEINAVQQTRLQVQVPASTRSLGMAKMFTTYGGGLLIWLVGVAAFLLFYDEKARAWKGVERRVHTKILQTLPLGVSVATDSGIILYANPAEEALMGYQPGELLGNNATLLHDLEGPSRAQTVNEILDRLGSDRVWAGELPVRKKDGTIRKVPSWVMNLAVPGKVYRAFVHNGD